MKMSDILRQVADQIDHEEAIGGIYINFINAQ
jgi:hypothetical protein